MTIRSSLLCALIGWLAGLCVTLVTGFVIFPALLGDQPSLGIRAELLILVVVLLLVTPAALIGGLIGGRLPREGGKSGQLLMAGIIGIIVALPFSCVGFWFSGW